MLGNNPTVMPNYKALKAMAIIILVLVFILLRRLEKVSKIR